VQLCAVSTFFFFSAAVCIISGSALLQCSLLPPTATAALDQIYTCEVIDIHVHERERKYEHSVTASVLQLCSSESDCAANISECAEYKCYAPILKKGELTNR
jgi:hypothetical protein